MISFFSLLAYSSPRSLPCDPCLWPQALEMKPTSLLPSSRLSSLLVDQSEVIGEPVSYNIIWWSWEYAVGAGNWQSALGFLKLASACAAALDQPPTVSSSYTLLIYYVYLSCLPLPDYKPHENWDMCLFGSLMFLRDSENTAWHKTETRPGRAQRSSSTHRVIAVTHEVPSLNSSINIKKTSNMGHTWGLKSQR